MPELSSYAELKAKEACDLPAFNNINLIGVKARVADMLEMIGRVHGIFSTYTKHDISHINTILTFLDWLIPPKTKESMTPADWLMVVLSIYLHDLGMLVTSEEYENRMSDPEFKNFLSKLENSSEDKDYYTRAINMEPDERERFFYQEFIRLHHASRIREWITGRHSYHWGGRIDPITSEIATIMENLPPRFREHLATVCESHHKDNLDNFDIYPLYQSYGNLSDETANVHYAAILLRTVDLIHVTKDRTPSVMYKTISFTDLKSINEWEKQRGIFALSMMTRIFNETDTESHYIKVSADFTEERPFFALTEYIAWANDQVAQTKRWADKGQAEPNGQNYSFPWLGITSDIRVEGNSPKQMKFELDRGKLLNLLVGHTIYNDPTVAIRELLQNSIDAVRFQYHQERREAASRGYIIKPEMGKVVMRWNPEQKELIIQDNGTGMNLDIIQNHLLKVGSSFYDTPRFNIENSDFTPISRFGIGLLTCFMISDDLEIITCSSNVGRRIRMTSVHAEYLLKDLSAGDPQLAGIEPHGTKVRLKLRPSVKIDRSILSIAKQWIVLPACEVVYSDSAGIEVKLGYNNISEALQQLYSEAHGSALGDEELDIITYEDQDSEIGQYEIAFIVRKGFDPGRPFKHAPKITQVNPVATVCVEGIRVGWSLPGFSGSLMGILSVRGNRKFRTTVSRDGLERDDEYEKVSTICAKSLFSHITSEVNRISTQQTNPLSQASSSAMWIYSSLTSLADETTRPILNALYHELPVVVVEHLEVNAGERKSNRVLANLRSIASSRQFWTVESRTVDYLGTISRDLGRELSINEFIGSLAPEILRVDVNPLIPDATIFSDYLRATHYVTKAEFSRLHRQTLLKWEQVTSKNLSQLCFEILGPLSARIIVGYWESIGISTDTPAGRRTFSFARERGALRSIIDDLSKIAIADIEGDMPGIIGVKSRICTVVPHESEVGIIWGKLREVAEFLLESKVRPRLTLPIFTLGLILVSVCTSNDDHYYGDRFSGLKAAWRTIIPDIEKIVKETGVDIIIPESPAFLKGGDKRWFNASSYWQDWFNRQ
jgi:molecular chaperone HtpG